MFQPADNISAKAFYIAADEWMPSDEWIVEYVHALDPLQRASMRDMLRPPICCRNKGLLIANVSVKEGLLGVGLEQADLCEQAEPVPGVPYLA